MVRWLGAAVGLGGLLLATAPPSSAGQILPAEPTWRCASQPWTVSIDRATGTGPGMLEVTGWAVPPQNDFCRTVVDSDQVRLAAYGSNDGWYALPAVVWARRGEVHETISLTRDTSAVCLEATPYSATNLACIQVTMPETNSGELPVPQVGTPLVPVTPDGGLPPGEGSVDCGRAGGVVCDSGRW